MLFISITIQCLLVITVVRCEDEKDFVLAPPLSDEEFESARSLAEKTIAEQEMNSCQADAKSSHCRGGEFDQELEKRRTASLDFAPREDVEKVYEVRPNMTRWKGGILPYELSDVFGCQDRRHIAWCIDYIEHYIPCVKIVPRDGQKDFARLIASREGCNAYQGNRGGKHEINLNIGGACTKDLALITHMFLHVLGASHEHTRPDRDDHIKIHWENLWPDWIIRHAYWKTSWKGESQGQKLCKDQPGPNYDDCVSGEEVEKIDDLPYDLYSLMHFTPRSFSDNGNRTMDAHDGTYQFGLFRRMTWMDVRKLRRAYGCDDQVDPPEE